MRTFVISLLLISGFQLWSQDQAWTNKKRVLPDVLRKVPEAILIRHLPNPNYPEPATPEDKTEYAYVWKHSTSITAVDQELTVKYAGSYIWYSEEGWKKNVFYNKKKFAKQFNCPKGVLKKGVTYTFEKNYRYGNQPYGGDALWYVIAEDKEGNIYKGMSILETEAEIQKK
ncbi:MAG: hypothetical protein AAFY71_20540 [Bacteroidota bacterium]